jgi:hypothetical protein
MLTGRRDLVIMHSFYSLRAKKATSLCFSVSHVTCASNIGTYLSFPFQLNSFQFLLIENETFSHLFPAP